MKIYLAGPCDRTHRPMMESIAAKLRENYEVYCPFELKIENAWDYTQEEWARRVFSADIAAIQEADLFLLISYGRESTAGTNWEQGYAWHLGKKVVVLQITEAPTSLMTFTGCHYFKNSSEEKILEDIAALMRRFTLEDWYVHIPKFCTTVLT